MERLLSLNVADVMCREVVQVSVHDTIEAAAAVFAKHEVSGAPVVDETGRCVGVLTSGDFVRREAHRAAASTEPFTDTNHVVKGGEHGEPLHVERAEEHLVSRYMSPAVQTVAADSPLVTAARIMDAGHIHRLIVVDDKGFPVGLLSSMDVVAAVINSVDEMLAESSRL
ncbi:MAG: CBS domain-containing protein [Pirellulales bacterium]|nr:CBS domain-containing protein [Pirellulales bacterium]